MSLEGPWVTPLSKGPVSQTLIPQDAQLAKTDPSTGDEASIVSAGNTTSSALSIRSLKRRLQDRGSTSVLGDVQSLIGRLSISFCSEFSTAQSKKGSSLVREPMLTSTPNVYSDVSLFPIPVANKNNETLLIGRLPQYLWEHILQNRLFGCGDVRLPCNHYPMFILDETGIYEQATPGVLSRVRTQSVSARDLSAIDSFGNTILHVAAAFGSSLTYMLSLIRLGADVKSLNKANQTFLHLVRVSKTEPSGSFRSLLSCLSVCSFDFLQQDLNGQTAIHNLAHDGLPWKIFSSIVEGFRSYNVNFKTCRDRMGHTIAQHLHHSGFTVAEEDLVDVKEYDLCHGSDARCHAHQIPQSYHDFYHDTWTDHETLRYDVDMIMYDEHTKLLRTVIKAGEDPSFEDVEGRNGLHCLARVSLTLSHQLRFSPQESPVELCQRRQRYLHQLLENGVNPNSYDGEGSTPLMSFVIFTRDDESDDQTTHSLDLLVNAGANINNRNRQGESALHIAVRLGRRSVTEFLLSHGANVHARTDEGLGVLAYGVKYSERASDDSMLYAQISLCICLVGRAGAVAAPTILDEWTLPEWRNSRASASTCAVPQTKEKGTDDEV